MKNVRTNEARTFFYQWAARLTVPVMLDLKPVSSEVPIVRTVWIEEVNETVKLVLRNPVGRTHLTMTIDG